MKDFNRKNKTNTLPEIENKLRLTKREQEFLDDLLIFNQRLEEIYFSPNRLEESIAIIDNLIDDKLSTLDSFQAYKLLNQLYKNNITDAYPGTVIRILNNIECDLVKERVSLLLIPIALYDNNYFNYITDVSTTGFLNYSQNNMLAPFCENPSILNYYYMLDNTEKFIGIINDDEIISKNIKEDTINKLLFIYKDLDIELEKINRTSKATKLISNRYDASSIMTLEFNFDFIKEELITYQFLSEAETLLEIEDSKITDHSTLIMGRHYLNNLLDDISNKGFKQLFKEYKELENSISLKDHSESLSYIYDSINKKMDTLPKEKKKKL